MAKVTYGFLLIHFYCVFMVKLLMARKSVNTPHGPTICRELCQSLDDSFSFFEEYHCRRIHKDDSDTTENRSTLDYFACNVNGRVTVGKPVWKNIRGDELCFPDETTNIRQPQHKSNSSLHQACRDGNLCVVKYILKQGIADINSRDSNGYTPVMTAAIKAQADVFGFLVSQGCDMLALSDNNSTLLHLACWGGNIEIVKTVLACQNYGVDSRGWQSWTPLMYAVEQGHREVFDLLLENGADVKAVTAMKRNILHVACCSGQLDMAKMLLHKNFVGIESRDSSGKTPVMFAAKYGYKNVFDLLCSRGCNVTAVNEWKGNILHFACAGGEVDMVRHILNKDLVNIESTDRFGLTPVIIAAKNSYLEVIDLLVSSGCNLKAVSSNGNGILEFACKSGNVSVVRFILSQHVVNIDNRGYRNRTPVLTAVLYGHKDVAEILVNEGCDLKVTDCFEYNILHTACSGGSVDTVKYVLNMNIVSIESKGHYNRTAVMVAAIKGHVGAVETLVNKGCNLKTLDFDKNTLLHAACIGGHVDVVKYVLSQDAADLESRDHKGRTPVMKATHRGHTEVVTLLVDRGCKLTSVDDRGDNILHIACRRGNEDMVKYILSKHAVSIGSRGYRGRTPVMTAAGMGHREVVTLLVNRCKSATVNYRGRSSVRFTARKHRVRVASRLVRKNCDLDVVDDEGNTALHLSSLGGYHRVVEYLLSLGVSVGKENMRGRTPLQIAQLKNNTPVVALLKARLLEIQLAAISLHS